ncbi:hypothetical protein [Cohnella sp. GCM10012308]|uniref:hypothetical protein n=1 Tax=Cohnella sp. GCM10012308 TaxID=3317329 RepID=UPI00360A9DD7
MRRRWETSTSGSAASPGWRRDENVNPLWLGTAKKEISPQRPMPLAGFGHRTGVFEMVALPLYVKVWLFERKDAAGRISRALLAQADILAWNEKRMDFLLGKLEALYGLPPSAVILQASHTHGGPWTVDLAHPADGAYVRFLEAQLLAGVEEACGRLVPVVAEQGAADFDLGINRRKFIAGRMTMAPNPEGPTDPEVRVVRYRERSSARDVGVLFHYTCHPTVTDANAVSAEYPGVAMERVEAALDGGAIASFLQGCCGDIRPKLIRDGEFYRGGIDDVRLAGDRLADVVLGILNRPMEALPDSPLVSGSADTTLPFARLPDTGELVAGSDRPGMIGEWSRLLLGDPSRLAAGIRLRMNAVRLADGLTLVAMNGELTVAYGLFLKRQSRGVLPLAYGNGMIGYVPTAAQLVEGGYEALESIYYFGLPGPFSPEIERKIRTAAADLLRKIALPVSDP